MSKSDTENKISISLIKSLFDKGIFSVYTGEYKSSSVLIPLIEKDGEIYVLFEIRSNNLKTQPGEVCFPGGKININETPLNAVIRETSEELLINKSQINIIGSMLQTIGPGGIMVNIYVGIISDYNNTFSQEEVKEVFMIPLRWFIENPPEFYSAKIKMIPSEDIPWNLIPGGKRYKWGANEYRIPFYTNAKPLIWGVTARILYEFTKIVNEYVK